MGVGDLFGGDIVGRADNLPIGGRLAVRRPVGFKEGQPQVEDLHLAVRGNHQVRRLDIAMDQPALVGRVQANRDLADDLAGIGHGSRPARSAILERSCPSMYSRAR